MGVGGREHACSCNSNLLSSRVNTLLATLDFMLPLPIWRALRQVNLSASQRTFHLYVVLFSGCHNKSTNPAFRLVCVLPRKMNGALRKVKLSPSAHYSKVGNPALIHGKGRPRGKQMSERSWSNERRPWKALVPSLQADKSIHFPSPYGEPKWATCLYLFMSKQMLDGILLCWCTFFHTFENHFVSIAIQCCSSKLLSYQSFNLAIS